MNDLIEFVTSQEVMVVFVVIAIALFLCLIIYVVDKNYDKRKRRHNTKELKKLVEEVAEEERKLGIEQEEKEEESLTPEIIIPEVEVAKRVVEHIPAEETIVETEIDIDEPVVEVNETQESINKINNQIDDLVYTNAEPDKEEATRELLKITEELEKAAREQNKEIDIDAYESAQEENAIISLDELTKRSEEMYAANEITQYEDEGNEPISLEDLEKRKQDAKNLEEPVQQELPLETVDTSAYHGTKTAKQEIFSSVFGVEKKNKIVQTEEELEKTSQFLLSIKDLQDRLNS